MNELDRQRVLHLAMRKVPTGAKQFFCLTIRQRLIMYRVLLLLGAVLAAVAVAE